MGGMKLKGSDPPGRTTFVAFALFLVALLPLAYALSAGPAAWLCVNGYISPDVWEMYVFPLRAVSRPIPFLEWANLRYELLWI
jgi:hypothetical protein